MQDPFASDPPAGPPPEEGDPGRAAWSFARVLRLMYDKERTGVLEVRAPEGEWEIHLRKGYVVNVVAREGDQWILGDVLVASGAVTDPQMLKANRRSDRTGEAVERVLVDLGVVTLDVLRKYMELQVRETVLPLFRRVGITCRFREEAPDAPETVSPVPISFLLKEAERRLKEWPDIERAVPSDLAVYGKVDGTVAEVFGGAVAGAGDDDAIPADIGPNERIVYFYANGKKTVQQLAMATALGDHDTRKALARLADEGLVELLASRGEGERGDDQTVFPLLFRMLFYVVLAVALASLVLWRVNRAMDPALASVQGDESAALRAHEIERLHAAAELHEIERGSFPPSLDDLIAARLLDERDIRRLGGPEAVGYEVGPKGRWYRLAIDR